jgi:hypothetical protein
MISTLTLEGQGERAYAVMERGKSRRNKKAFFIAPCIYSTQAATGRFFLPRRFLGLERGT